MNQVSLNFDTKRQAFSDKEIILDVVRCKSELFRSDFRIWLIDNYSVWQAFETHANMIWERGRDHYSARTIIEFLRHESAIREKSSSFKLSDWWTPDLARLYMLLRPERDGFFELRGRH